MKSYASHYVQNYQRSLFVPVLVFLGLLVLGMFSELSAQQSEIPKIKKSDDYYWGESCAENIQVANDNALQGLISKIAVRVSADFQSKLVEESNNDSTAIREKTKNVVQTYSTATLKNLQTIKFPDQCGINVFNYITKKQVASIFEERKQLVGDLFLTAQRFKNDGNYAGALKLYYFSTVLMNSIPQQTIQFGGYNLTTEIPIRINEILQNVEFEVLHDELVDDQTREITLGIKGQDQEEVKRLDFSYWDGNTQIHSKGKDGESVIQLYGSSTQLETLSLKVKYDYYQQRDEIKQVGQLWDLVSKPTFENRKRVSLDAPDKMVKETEKQMTDAQAPDEKNTNKQTTVEAGNSDQSEETNSVQFAGSDYPEKIKPQMSKLTRYFNQDSLPAQWAQDAFLKDKLNRVKDFNQISIKRRNTDSLKINKTFEGWEGRKVPVLSNYETLHIQSNEYLVPDFTEKGMLTDLNFGVMEGFYNKFKRQSQFGKDWKERKVIIKFMEKYRTAFLSRDIDQLNTMFADEAVIIVGRVLETTEAEQQYNYEQSSDQPDIEYLRFSKKEYLQRQARLFKEKEDLYLEFSSFNIFRKNNQPGIYGISLRQHYYSTNYSDEGYLFLLIDFNSEKPKIHVRAWQPQKWSEESLIGLADFHINY